jgi:dienelactone hydrolase
MRTLLAPLALLACTAEPEPSPVPYVVPDGAVVGLYTPLRSVTTFPDDVQTVDDAATRTGLRLRFQAEAEAELRARVPPSINLVEALYDLDGFGTLAGVTLQFSDALDPVGFEEHVHLVRLSDGEPAPVELWWTDLDRTVVIEPLFALDEATAYGLLVDDGVRTATGEAVWASPVVRALAAGTATDPALVRVLDRWASALEATGLSAEQVVAGTVFTTQDVTSQDAEVVAALAELSPRLQFAGGCAVEEGRRRCPALLVAANPVGADGVLGPDEAPDLTVTYTLTVDVWLPDAGLPGPYPTIVFGHGLGGDRGEARGFSMRMAERGYAVLAVDAPGHGDHPTATQSGLLQVFDFFGIVIAEAGLNVRRLRDNFRLATWDKLQLTAAVRAGVDADGDGQVDLDAAALHFSGHSLGGLMGVPMLAWDEGVRSAHLSVPGGRVSTIVHRGKTFAPLVGLMAPPGTPTAEIDRFFPLLQTAIERGEPANVAGRITASGRDVFATLVLDDDIIPNTCGRAMARALGVQPVGEAFEPIAGLPHADLPYPVQANLPAGGTGVLVSFDEMVDGGELVDATHSHIYDSDSHRAQVNAWFDSLTLGRGVVVAPEPE